MKNSKTNILLIGPEGRIENIVSDNSNISKAFSSKTLDEYRTEAFASLLAREVDACGRVVTGNDTHAACRAFRAEARAWLDGLAPTDLAGARHAVHTILRRAGVATTLVGHSPRWLTPRPWA